ncbi:hypothetical protein J1N35_029300 [Gossypium stocksii]|uniref:Uncharacterized protein n=1 Tax=Gossypium stocksii TaxID=47602 RepID=A0A9D3ZT06_9ROSI|nr:hypothetical protein J1N35_029300 [Gossypium stocksii]
MELAGFRSTTLILTFNLQYDLISALAEKRRNASSFYSMLHYNSGSPLMGTWSQEVRSLGSAALCYNLLGRSPSEEKFTGLRFSWLKIIEGVFMPDTNNNKVHLIWSTNLSIGRSYMVLIYSLMIQNHAGDGTMEWYHGDQVLRQFSCIQYISTLLVQLGTSTGLTRGGNMEMIGQKCMKNILQCGTTGRGR